MATAQIEAGMSDHPFLPDSGRRVELIDVIDDVSKNAISLMWGQSGKHQTSQG